MKETKISVILPCLNEEESIFQCVSFLDKVLQEFHKDSEIIIVDNNSTDDSVSIVKEFQKEKKNINLIQEKNKGYGNTLRKGFSCAKNDLIYMADCDNTYDFNDIKNFVLKIEEGHDFVVGNRFNKNMKNGVMPFLRRFLGNPVLSFLTRVLYKVNIQDIHCGARMIKKDVYKKLDLKSKGMEFATEMIVVASRKNLRMTQIDTTYHPRTGNSKLNPLYDGFRHIVFMATNLFKK